MRLAKHCGAAGFNMWLHVVQLIGLAVFLFGFFLTRFEIPHTSMCNDSSELLSQERQTGKGDDANDGACWHPRRFDKAVVVVIDALRLDFAFSEPNEANNKVRLHEQQ